MGLTEAFTESVQATSWCGQLTIEFERRASRTVLSARRHDGPLVVQKPLYPEGDAVCHIIVAHPPGGIAGGDDLQLEARLQVDAQALLTTPGAGKWYRSLGAQARQSVHFDLRDGASLEWLPQENIIFNGAGSELSTVVRLSGDASYIGWEICCFGRTGSGETFANGSFRARTLIERDGRPLWLENGRLDGGAGSLQSAVMLAGQTVVGTLMATRGGIDSALLAACRALQPALGDGAVTLLPGLFIGRYLGASSEAAKNYFISLWHRLRPAVTGRIARNPRIWQT